MKILYISSLMSDESFDCLISQGLTCGYTGQKYHGLLVSGLAANLPQNAVTVLSFPPVNTTYIKKSEIISGVIFKYIPIVPIPFLKQFIVLLFSFVYSLIWCIRNKGEEKVVICSLMRIYQIPPVYIATKLFNCKYLTVACDIPWLTILQVSKGNVSKKVKFSIKMSQVLCSKFDGYILLTESMNNLINKSNKPCIVIEGFSDITMKEVPNTLNKKASKSIILYAGGLNEKYGIIELVEAIQTLENNDGVELWLFGDGDLSDYLERIDNPRIKYWGVRPNKEVVQHELEADILINPRPTNDEYTRYSFPSKTLEYMVSGTYTITTKLEGIPDEYFSYCGLINGCDVKSIQQAILNALSKGRNRLHEEGLRAKNFALREKNNVRQASKIIEFISNNL